MRPIKVMDAGPSTDESIYWPELRFDFTTGDLDYLGKHYSSGAATSDGGWLVWKFTWSSSLPTRIQGPIVGSWDNRASLSW